MIQAMIMVGCAIFTLILFKEILSGGNQETIKETDTKLLLEENRLTLDEQIKLNESQIQKNAEEIRKETKKMQREAFDELHRSLWSTYSSSNPSRTGRIVSSNSQYGNSPLKDIQSQLKGIQSQMYSTYFDDIHSMSQSDYEKASQELEAPKINFFSNEQKDFLGKLVNSVYFSTLDKSEQKRIKKFLEIRIYNNTDREFLNKIRTGYIKSKTRK